MKNYVYTDLTVKNSVSLEIAGEKYEVVQYSSSWAANEIPTAAIMLAIGRDARKRHKVAKIHETGRTIKQMERAVVYFQPTGTRDRGVKWPGGRVKIFDGFFTGFAYRKISGKVCVIANLIHWSAALAFSSSLTKNGHVSNPTALNAAAVLQSLQRAGSGTGNYISLLVPHQLCAQTVTTDLWLAVKDVFCKLASIPTMPCGPEGQCGGTGQFQINDTALEALSRIEGPASDCNLPYEYGVPLKIQSEGVPTIEDAISSAIGNEFIESYSGVSFWDKLVSQLCPMFGMSFVPMVETAIVVADCPAFRGDFWKEIKADDYDSYDIARELHRPLRGVGVVANYESQTQASMNEYGDNLTVIGGCFVEDSVRSGDGMLLYVASPPWLRVLNSQPHYAAYTTGLKNEQPIKGLTSPNATVSDADVPTPDTIGIRVDKLYERYAHEVYVNQMLRGQAGAFSGKLRFDIAPLSMLKINATTEKFIGPGQDSLAFDIYACVQRVTISINSEAGMAGTTFSISHVRTEAENSVDRTSVKEHPLFGASIHGSGKHGSPLIREYDIGLSAADGPAPPPIVT